MKKPKLLLLLLLATGIAVAAPAQAQRSIGGSTDDDEDDEDDDDAPAKEEPKKDEKKDDKKKKDEKKKDEKKEPEKKEEAKKEEPKKEEAKKADSKKTGPVDVLEETAEDKKKRRAEDEARLKAEEAAVAADKKKAEDKQKLAEEKKANEDKRRIETREQRLTSAKRIRPLLREDQGVSVQVAVEPGAVVRGQLVEIRLDVGRKLDVADPKFGSREPLKNLKLTATVIEPTGKKDAAKAYAVHSLGAPGAYGFHLTPPKDGSVQVQVTGDIPTEDGSKSLNVTFPLHIGVWPPPDFDDEDKKLVAKGS